MAVMNLLQLQEHTDYHQLMKEGSVAWSCLNFKLCKKNFPRGMQRPWARVSDQQDHNSHAAGRGGLAFE